MLAIPGILLLIIFIYARPQEVLERLRIAPFLHIFLAVAIFGGVLDVHLRNVRIRSSPQFGWVLLFLVWSAFTVLVRAPRAAPRAILELCVCIALYASIAHAVQTFRSLQAIAAVVLAMVFLVCGVGVHQAYAPLGCVMIDGNQTGHMTGGNADGRPCDTAKDCYMGETEPGAEYACEHVGLFGTTSVGGGRVRYRGVLQDPNELALAGGAGLPLAFAFGHAGRRRTLFRRVLEILAFALVLVCAVFTGSRGGQLVFLVVLATYFLRRFGRAGLVLGCVLGAPLMLLGGRSGEEASSSTMERIDCWAEALSMSRSHPLLGVGLGQFGEYNDLTAHNSYLLALSELGIPGMLLFTIIVYMSAKIPLAVLRQVTDSSAPEGAAIARPWATALLAAFAGLGVGIYFLSFSYHYVLWIYIGLSGALYMAVRSHLPSFKVRFGWGDFALVAALDAAVVLCTYLQTKWVLS
jgi:O-antigen ligase